MKKFFRYAILQNRWLWAHVLLGLIAAKILTPVIAGGRLLLIILVAALLWEVGEFLFTDVKGIYGGVSFFLMDAAGDVLGALVTAAIFIA